MKNKISTIGIVCLLVVGFLIGFTNLESKWACGTDVSGIVYDGYGGPWTLAGSPYIVVGDVTVPAGETLTIEPGVEVKFDGYYSLGIDGILNAIGNETNRITITSNNAEPMPGDWNTIWIAGHAEIKYCEISYGYNAISVWSSDNNITCNNLHHNELRGIVVVTSDHNNIMNNNVFNNHHGIWLNSTSNNNIYNNNLYSNTWMGFYLGIGDNNVIMCNNVSNNMYGIAISFSTLNNKIYSNNLINNVNQALDDSDNANQWDNGYPDGGNYWSDFDEASEGAYDDYNGPDQNVLGSDYIVDMGLAAGGGKNPYMIDSDSQDNYPLIRPYHNCTSVDGIFLMEGWNLISIPFIQSDTCLTSVLSSISDSYDAGHWYDAGDSSDNWKHYCFSKPPDMNDLCNLDHTMGFFLHITEPGGVLFEYPGSQPIQNQVIILHPGWNMVGYPSLISRNRTEGLNNLSFDTHVDAIWTYNAATQEWEELGPSDYFENGRGYWIHATTRCEWEVPL